MIPYLKLIELSIALLNALLSKDDKHIVKAVDAIVRYTHNIRSLEQINQRMQLLAARLQMTYLIERSDNETEHGRTN